MIAVITQVFAGVESAALNSCVPIWPTILVLFTFLKNEQASERVGVSTVPNSRMSADLRERPKDARCMDKALAAACLLGIVYFRTMKVALSTRLCFVF